MVCSVSARPQKISYDVARAFTSSYACISHPDTVSSKPSMFPININTAEGHEAVVDTSAPPAAGTRELKATSGREVTSSEARCSDR